jgi:hypothetical protein
MEVLENHPFVCGLFYGVAVFLVMNLVLLPLSAFPFKGRTFTFAGLIKGLLVHMFCIETCVSIMAAAPSLRVDRVIRSSSPGTAANSMVFVSRTISSTGGR